MSRVALALWFPLALAVPANATASSREVGKLIRQLKTARAEKAASRLADMGKDALDGLLAALQNKHWKVRYWAAYALAYSKASKDGGALEALKALLSDRKQRVRLRAAMALAKLGDKSGLDLAREHAGGEKAHLRAEAVAALAASGDAAVVPQLKKALEDSADKVRYWALIGLRDLAGAEALALGLKHLSDRSDEVKMAAMEVLGSAGKDSAEAEDSLLKLLSARKAAVRQYAASVLARIGGKRSLSALRKVREGDRASFVRDTADAAVVEIMKRLKAAN